jgi:hypothetical protein
MTELKTNMRLKGNSRVLLGILALSFVTWVAGWLYNVHQWLVESSAVHNVAGPQ